MSLALTLALRPHDVVSLVGGGGKTITILRLGWEFAQIGRRAIITTTTRMGPEQTGGHPFVTLGQVSHLSPELIYEVECKLEHNLVVMIVGESRTDKLIGVHPDVIAQLQPLADAVFVEADGARSRPLKAPAPYEPVWPSATTVAMAVIGIDAVGAPLDPAWIHRPERVAILTGLTFGELITPQAIATCVLHPEGLFARVPSGARRVILVNKVKTESQLAAAQEIAELLISQKSELHVIIADVQIETVRIW